MLDEWNTFKETLHVIAREDAELWKQLAAVYEQLIRTHKVGAEPPTPDQLSDLAAHVRALEF